MTTYSGGGAQQSRGYGYVRDPAEGFFVGGSTLEVRAPLRVHAWPEHTPLPHTRPDAVFSAQPRPQSSPCERRVVSFGCELRVDVEASPPRARRPSRP